MLIIQICQLSYNQLYPNILHWQCWTCWYYPVPWLRICTSHSPEDQIPQESSCCILSAGLACRHRKPCCLTPCRESIRPSFITIWSSISLPSPIGGSATCPPLQRDIGGSPETLWDTRICCFLPCWLPTLAHSPTHSTNYSLCHDLQTFWQYPA